MNDYSIIDGSTGATILRRVGDQNVVVGSASSVEEAAAILARLNRGERAKVGDLFEWVVAALFVAAAFDQTKSLPLSFTVAGVALFYLAQNLAAAEMPPLLPKWPAWVKRPHPIAALRRRKAQ